MLSGSISTGVSASRTLDINGWAAGNEAGTIEGAGETAGAGINVATGESPVFLTGIGDKDGSKTDIGVVIELVGLAELTLEDSRLSSSLAKSTSSFVFGNGYMSGSDRTGGELGVEDSTAAFVAPITRGFRLDTEADTVTVPVTVTFVERGGSSFAARWSARSLSKVLLRPATVLRKETVCALHVSDLVQGFPVSSFQTPQCRSGSYSRSLSNERSVLSFFRRGWFPLPGLFTGLEEAAVDAALGICMGMFSSGDLGEVRGNCGWRFACSAVLLFVELFVLLLDGICDD